MWLLDLIFDTYQTKDEAIENQWLDFVDDIFIESFDRNTANYNEARKNLQHLARVYYRSVCKHSLPTVFSFSDWLDDKPQHFIGVDFLALQEIFDYCDREFYP